MLLLGSRLINVPVMSLQTGAKLAHTEKPIINPGNLAIIAYEVSGPLLSESPSFVRTADIREYGRIGMIINSNDELCGLSDVIEIKRLYDINFMLIGLSVIDQHKRKLGKVEDYTLDTENFAIQQINVKRNLLQSFNDTGFLINRSQIIEINDTSIIVSSPTADNKKPVMEAMRGEFVNPFRSPAPQDSASTINLD